MTLYDEFCHHVGGRGFTNREYSDWLELQVEKLRAALEEIGAPTVQTGNSSSPKFCFNCAPESVLWKKMMDSFYDYCPYCGAKLRAS